MSRKKTKKNVKEKEIKKLGRENKRYRKNRILTIILHEGKGSSWFWIDDTLERFSVNEHTYFKVDDGTYVKDFIRLMVYLEGVSLPLHHGYLEKEQVVKTIKNKITKKQEVHKFWKIKGLKFDSKIIDIMLNRGLADDFTKKHMDLPNLVIIIMLALNFIFGVAGVIVMFFVGKTVGAF